MFLYMPSTAICLIDVLRVLRVWNIIEALYFMCAGDIVPLLNERAGLPTDTELALYEEIKPNLVDRLNDLQRPIEKVLEELMDGDIIVYQRLDMLNDNSLELPSAKDYLKDIYYRVEVTTN